MATSIRVALGVDGAREFQNAMNQSNAAIKELGSELKLATTQFAGAEKSEEAMRSKNEILERTIAELNKKLSEQENALAAVRDKFGDGSEETLKFQTEINKTKTAIAEAENNIKKGADALNDYGEQADDAGEKTNTFGDVLKASLTSEVIINGIKKITSALKDLTIGAASAADEILTESVVTGLSTDALQEYQYMAELVDVSVDTITGSLTKLTRNMQTASSGTGAAAEAFAALGVEVTNADGELRNNQDVFDEVINALGGIENETQRDAYAMSIFGKSAQELNPLIAQGAENIDAFRQEAHDMGYVLDSEALSSLGATDDAVQRMKTSLDSVKRSIGVELAPVVTKIVEAITEFTGRLDEFIPVIAGVTAGVGALAIALNMTAIIDAVKRSVLGLNAALSANPIGIVIALLAGLAAGFVTLYETNDEFREKVTNVWNEIKDAAERVFGRIKEVIDNVMGTITRVIDGIQNAWDKAKSFLGVSSSYMPDAANSAISNTNAAKNGNVVVNLTSQIDGQTLARSTYTYNMAEASRRGASLVGR